MYKIKQDHNLEIDYNIQQRENCMEEDIGITLNKILEKKRNKIK